MNKSQSQNHNEENNPVSPIASWLVTLTPFELNALSLAIATLLIEGLSLYERTSVSIFLQNVGTLMMSSIEQRANQIDLATSIEEKTSSNENNNQQIINLQKDIDLIKKQIKNGRKY